MQDLSLSEELGDTAGQAVTQRNMANTYDMMGSFDASLEWHGKVGDKFDCILIDLGYFLRFFSPFVSDL